MIRYQRKIQVEAYRLSIHNIDEMEAWTKWKRKKSDPLLENSQYLQHGEKICKLGDWIVRDEYTGKIDFYTMDNLIFLQTHIQI